MLRQAIGALRGFDLLHFFDEGWHELFPVYDHGPP
jgi:hypothetical protein